jgi:hypothetical protein
MKLLNNQGLCYAGNFWWASGKYLKKLFSEKVLKDGYYSFEYYIISNEPKDYNMFNIWTFYPKYDGYHHLLPLEMYEKLVQ